MKFMEQLKIASNHGLNIVDLQIANECDWVFKSKFTDEELEALCNCVRRAYFRSNDISIGSIVKLINGLIVENNWSIQEICDTPVCDLLAEMNYRQ